MARAINQTLRNTVHYADILTIHAGRLHTECLSAHEDVTCGRFRVVRVFGVEIVFADVDDGKLVKLGEVHHFIQDTLTESPFSEETDRYLAGAQTLRGK